MRKVIITLAAIALAVMPTFASAVFINSGAILLTRLEVSKDEVTWVNYLAETSSGNETFTVSPGDTVYFRLKTWDTGNAPAVNVTYSASYTNPQYIDALDPFHAGNQDNLDGDIFHYALSGLPDTTAGTLQFTLDAVANNSSDTANFESGGIVARVAAGTPDQTVILATIQITGSSLVTINWWENLLFSHAYADSSATTQARILVSNPPVATTPAVTALPATGPVEE